MPIVNYPNAATIVATANYTVDASQIGYTFANTGATGTVVFALPAAKVGMKFLFAVEAAYELRIDPNGTETIGLPSTGVQGAAGKYLTANAVGEYVHLECVTDGAWFCTGYFGTWGAES